MNTDTHLLRLKDEAGIHGEVVVDVDGLAATLHSWYISPDDPDIVEDPDLRETIVHAHEIIDDLVAAYLRGEGVREYAAYLDASIKPVRRTRGVGIARGRATPAGTRHGRTNRPGRGSALHALDRTTHNAPPG